MGRISCDDVNLLSDNIDTIKKNTQTLIDATTEVGQEVYTKKIVFLSLSPECRTRS
jgi:hypothetical protein